MTRRIVLSAVTCAVGALALVGCSSSSGGGSSTSSPSGSSSSSSSPIGSPSPTQAGGLCSDSAISEAANKIQAGSKVEEYECVKTATGEIAAVVVTAGGVTKSIFLQDEANTWVLVNNEVCNDPAAKEDSDFQQICSSN